MSRGATRLLLWCGAIGPPLFFLVFIVEGATRRGYDPVRLPISLLELGDLGWMQVGNFVLLGVLMLAFAIGLRRTLPSSGWPSSWGPILVSLFGIGLIGAAIFAPDPGGGFPPGFRAASGSSGTPHDLSTLVVFGSLIGSAAVFAWHFRGRGRRAWSAYSAVTSIALAIAFLMMFAGFSGTNEITPVAGIVQRVTIAIGWTWLALLAVLTFEAPGCRRNSHEATGIDEVSERPSFHDITGLTSTRNEHAKEPPWPPRPPPPASPPSTASSSPIGSSAKATR